MALSPQWLDELRSRTMLSALIGKSVKITRAGREWKACCPFHNEKTPSFTINDEKGFYHCFGCGAHGDAIRWMTDQRGLPFMDAVKELAAAAGMEVPAPDPRAAERQEQQKSLRDVTEAAANWFVDQLNGADGEAARAYIKQRGLSDEIRRAFGIGFAPDSRNRLRSALRDFPVEMLVESGMLIDPPSEPSNRSGHAGLPAGTAQQKREPYDRFRGRLMIPIRDARGRTIAFGGRILAQGEPKYLNSPDTPIFDKGRILYNLDRAAPAARAADRLIVVEGYMDVIALAQAGINEAVAPLGTALTEEQLILAWRQVPVPTLAFDGDAAGQRAAMRAAMRALPLLKPGYSLSILTLPNGQDPDDVVKTGGADAFNTLALNAQPLVAFLWQQALAQQRNDTPEGRAAVKAELMGWIDTIADRDVAAHYRRDLLDRYGARFFPPREARAVNRGGGFSSARLVRAHPATSGASQPVDNTLTQALLGGLLNHPSLIASRIDLICQLPLTDAVDHRLVDAMIDAVSSNPGLDKQGLLTILAPLDVYNRAVELVRADRVQFSFTRSMAGDADEPVPLPPQGVAQLDELLGSLAAWPEVERALENAEAQVKQSLDEASWAEQQRARAAHEGLRERLRNFAEQASASDV
jgi:DNA primase